MIERIAKFFRDAHTAYRWRRYWDLVGVDPEELRHQLQEEIEKEMREKLQHFVGMNMDAGLQKQIEDTIAKYLAEIEDRMILGTPAVKVQRSKKRPRLRVEDGRLIRNVDDLMEDLGPVKVDVAVQMQPLAEYINLQLAVTPEEEETV